MSPGAESFLSHFAAPLLERPLKPLLCNQLIAENSWQILRFATGGAMGNSVLLFEQHERKSNRTGKNLPEKRTKKEMAGYFAPGDTFAHFRPDKASFLFDWEREIAICPAGKQNYSWLPNGDRSRGVVGGIRVQFSGRDCSPCPLRPCCTRAKVAPRELVLLPRDRYEALREAKSRQTTAEFREEYAMRAGIESTHAQGVRRSDLRRSRYVGLAKTRLQHIFTAIALNVVRAVEWLTDTTPAQPPQPRTRVSHFAALEKVRA